MKLGIVCVGGDSTTDPQLLPPRVRAAADAGDAFVVAADSGLDLAERLGLRPDLVVGDLDSVSPEALERARTAGVRIEIYPTAKDDSDLQLALAAVSTRGVDQVVILGGAGGRLDHLLIGVAVIGGVASDWVVEAWLGSQYLAVVTGRWSATLPKGTLVSLLAWNGPATVTTTGLKWPLDRHELSPASALGLSNETMADAVDVTVHSGSVFILIPEGSLVP